MMLFKNKSISTSVTIGLVTTVILIVAVMLMVQYIRQSQAMRQEIEQKADEYTVGLTTILAIPLWTLDTANTEHIGKVYQQNELFSSLEILDNRGNSMFSFGSPPPPEEGIIREQDISFEGETIGQLRFSLSLKAHNNELTKLLTASLLTLGVAALVILAATGALLRVFMRKPLAALEHGMDSVSRGEFVSQAIEAGYTELENIVATFKEMAATIQAREAALIQVNSALSREVAERKTAEEARAKSESTLKAIFNAAPIGIGQIQDHILFWPNERMVKMLGYSAKEITGNTAEIFHADKEEFIRVSEHVGAEIERIGFVSFETQWQTKQGAIIDVNISIAPITPDDPESVYVFTALDVTGRKRAEAALRESEQRLHLALSGTNDGLWDWSINEGTVYYSPRYATMLGYDTEDLPLDYGILSAICHPEDYPRVDAFVTNYLEHEEGEYSQEFRAIKKNGELCWILSRGMIAERDDEGRPARFVGTHTDITDRKSAETMREQLIDELEDKNAELERFTYTVSHDLKSPIITIKGFLGMLDRDMAVGDRDRIKSDMNRIHQAADKMQQLLDELLELSRIGRLENPPEDIDLNLLTRDVTELVFGRLREGGITVDIQPGLPVVRGDRPRIQEVFQNLVDNAAKFMGDQKNPTITIGTRETQKGETIFVEDNGIGIKSEHYNKVFGLFDQLDPKKEGTGIGLALVQRIVETHGGHIWVESEGAGRGTTFYLTLPRAESAA